MGESVNLIDSEISLRIQLRRYHTYVDFTPVLLPCTSRVRFTNCSCARSPCSSRSDFCRAMEFRYFCRGIGSSTVVLSCQNNAESTCHERTFIRSEEYNAPYMNWRWKGLLLVFWHK